MSWWICDRATFTERLAERFSVNKADPPRRGMAAKWTKAQASRGGKGAKREYRPQAEDREKRTA